jgi:tRNA modification GTPase
MFPLDDTIAAISSPPGGAARGMVRLSGPQSLDCAGALFQATSGELLSSAHAPCIIAGSLHLAELHAPLPCDLMSWPEGHSYTGQTVAEIHTLGSPPLLELVLCALCAAGARLAGPGEFTLRAFLSGRIDLTQAEAVLGIIDAHNPRELDVALAQLAGGLARPLHRLRDGLLDVLAHVEAGFDFADEPIDFITREELDYRLAGAEADVLALARQLSLRNAACDAWRVVLFGRPNTGKSSLFNALAGDRAALVSEHPGTTRDYLTVELDLEGVKCQLVDTAGAGGTREESGERREERAEGWAVRRPLSGDIAALVDSVTAEQRGRADVPLLCLDSTRPPDDWERGQLARQEIPQRIVVLTKCDVRRHGDSPQADLQVSSLTGQGIAALRAELRRRVLAANENRGAVVAATAVRCADSLRLAAESLGRARPLAAAGREELAAAEIRRALDELGSVAGKVYTDDLLDRIFSRFCIGK